MDAAARARALNAGGTEGRFSSCTSEGLDRDPRPAKTRAEVAHPPSPVPPHTASGDMLTASAIAHRPSLSYTRPTTRVIAHRRGPLTVKAYGEPGAMNDDARRRPSIQSMGSADRLEVMRAKPLFTIGLFADAQYADKDDFERPSEPGRVKYFRASATRLADALVDFRAKGESMACIVNLGDLIDGYNDDDVTVPVPTRTGPVPTHLADKSRADMAVMRSVIRAGAGATQVYHCIGNHDCNLPREEVCQTLGNPKNAAYFSVKLPRGWRLLVLDTTEVNPRYETPGSDAQVAGAAFVESAKSKPGKFILIIVWANIMTYGFIYLCIYLFSGGAERVKPWGGGLGETQTQWLRRELEAATARHEKVIVASHIALSPTAARPGMSAWRSDEVSQTLESFDCVKACVAVSFFLIFVWAISMTACFVYRVTIIRAGTAARWYPTVRVSTARSAGFTTSRWRLCSRRRRAARVTRRWRFTIMKCQSSASGKRRAEDCRRVTMVCSPVWRASGNGSAT